MRSAAGILLLYVLLIGGFVLVGRAGGPQVTPCLFRNATGHPCFLCGGTRAAGAWATGDWATAFFTNPLAALALTAGGMLVVVRLVTGRSPRIPPHARRVAWMIAVLAAALNWWWVWTHLPR